MKKQLFVVLVIGVVVAVACGSFFIGAALPKNTEDVPGAELSDFFSLEEGEPVYVVGHKNPDLDSICSAIGLAELLQKAGFNAIPAVCGEIPPVVTYVLDFCGKESPVLLDDAAGKHIVMVDHNSFQQGVANLDKADIIGIFDHHNLDGPYSDSVIYAHLEPVGATATIVAELYWLFDTDLDSGMAELLLYAILDDTLNLRSASMTEFDKYVVRALQKRTGIVDTDAIYAAICAIETSHEGMTDEDILHSDEKPYTMGDYAVHISDVRVMGKAEQQDMVARLQTLIDDAVSSSGREHRYVIVSDMDSFTSELIYAGRDAGEFAAAAFPSDSEGRIVFDTVVVRKSFIVPNLMGVYEEAAEHL